MPLPRPFFTPSFRTRRLGLFFGFIVGIMVYLATFTVAAEATLSAATFTWDRGMENRLTVEIPAVGDESSTPQSERVRQAMSVLRAMPGVLTVTQIPEAETEELLKPWINQPDLLRSLPIPALIDIERRPGVSLAAGDIQSQLRPTVRDARVEDHASWLADFAHLVRGLAAFGFLTIVLAALTLAVTVSLVCRAVTATERETITLLHSLGAEDTDIAQHFELQARRLAAPAALTGFILAMLSAATMIYFLHPFIALAFLEAQHWVVLAAICLAVPLAAIWIAAGSARVAVLNFLYTMS